MESRSETRAFRQLAAASSKLKLVCFVLLVLLICAPYFWLERHPLFSVLRIPPSTIDRWIPFVPGAGWIYLSLYLQMCLPLLLVRESERLRQMVFGFAWIVAISHLVFFFWPAAVASSAWPATNPSLRLIAAADNGGNAFPSLHASLAIYCALCAASLLKNRTARFSLWAWTALIVASTLLARRHEFVDIVAGAALGAFAYGALFRRHRAEEPQCDAWQTTLQARRSLVQGREAELASLLQLDWRRRSLEVACFLSLAVAGVCVNLGGRSASSWPLIATGTLLTALALNAFILLMHDGMHFTLARNRRGNWLASVVLGSTFLMSFTAYRVLHTRHHKFLGDSRDPDDYYNYVRLRPLVWVMHFVRLTVGPLLYLGLIPVLALKHANEKERRLILGEYGFLLAVYSAALRSLPLSLLVSVYVIPLLIVGSLTAIRGFTQHGITDATDPLLASRTVLPNRVIGFFLLHENYHLEHHLFPEVPSYHLPRLHRLIWGRLPRAVSSRGYLSFLGKFLRATPGMDETPIGLEHPSRKSA